MFFAKMKCKQAKHAYLIVKDPTQPKEFQFATEKKSVKKIDVLLAQAKKTPAKGMKKLKRARTMTEQTTENLKAKVVSTEDRLIEQIHLKGGFKALPLNKEIFKPVENTLMVKPETTKP